ncbi:MAG: hypothetical protein HGA85_07570, partial [Nanoarchaeota archaeon]|nr:hypothetical protein [Nanoarchaeota archaeon]
NLFQEGLHLASSINESYAHFNEGYPEARLPNPSVPIIDGFMWSYASLVMSQKKKVIFSAGYGPGLPEEALSRLSESFRLLGGGLLHDHSRMTTLGNHWRRHSILSLIGHDYALAAEKGIRLSVDDVENINLVYLSSGIDDLAASERNRDYVSSARQALERIVAADIKHDSMRDNILVADGRLALAATPSIVFRTGPKSFDVSKINDFFYNPEGIGFYRDLCLLSREYAVKGSEMDCLDEALTNILGSLPKGMLEIHDLASGFGDPGILTYIRAATRGFTPKLTDYDSSEQMLVNAGITARSKGVLPILRQADVCDYSPPENAATNLYLCAGNVALDWSKQTREKFYNNLSSGMNSSDYFIIGVRISDDPEEVRAEYQAHGEALNRFTLEKALNVPSEIAANAFEYKTRFEEDMGMNCLTHYFTPNKTGKPLKLQLGSEQLELDEEFSFTTFRMHVMDKAAILNELRSHFNVENTYGNRSYLLAVCKKPSLS